MSSEVKGVWFVTARSYVLAHGGAPALEALLGYMDREHHEAITEPLASAWYPERALGQALAGMRQTLAGGDASEFREIMEECTRIGVNRFFRVLIRVSAPAFVLRQVPTMWRMIRRGDGDVVVEPTAGGTLIHYSGFPCFDDANYRLMTKGSLAALVRLCTQKPPLVDVVDYGRDWLDARIVHG